MKRILILLFIIASGLTSCDKDYGTFNSDNRPEIPVTFPDATTFGFNPYITYSLSSGKEIELKMSIPATSGRTIKEITKVAGGTSSVNAASLNASTYITSPIAVNSAEYVFKTTLQEFISKAKVTPVAGGEIAFMFLITLDDGTTIIPVQVRARIVA